MCRNFLSSLTALLVSLLALSSHAQVVLAANKTGPASASLDTPMDWTITVSNTGATVSPAEVVVADALPPQFELITVLAGANAISADCFSDGGGIATGVFLRCRLNTTSGIAPGGSAAMVLRTVPRAGAPANAVNRARVSVDGTAIWGDGFSPRPPRIPAEACVSNGVPAGCALAATSIVQPQLSLTKESLAATWPVDQPNRFQITVANRGGQTTTAVVEVRDQLPPNYEFVQANPGSGANAVSCTPAGTVAAGQLLVCQLTTAAGILPDSLARFTVTTTPRAAASGVTATNRACVSPTGSGTTPDPASATGNGSPLGCGVVTVTASSPLLTLTKIASATSFTVGSTYSYTLRVQNNGTGATTAPVTVTDPVPTVLSIGVLPAGCASLGQRVTCSLASGLPVGGSVDFVFPVALNGPGASVTNTASVIGGDDPVCTSATVALPARCNASVTTPVLSPALSLSKSVATSPLSVGLPTTYTLRVTNIGTAATTAPITIRDDLPMGLTIGDLPVGCVALGQTVVCTVATGLRAGASATVLLPVTPTSTATSPVTNTANVTGGGDPTCTAGAPPSRCSASVITPLLAPLAQLAISKRAPGPWRVASRGAFVITITNANLAGAAPNAILRVLDKMPPNYAFRGVTPGSGVIRANCNASGSVADGELLSCDIDTGVALAPSASAAFTIKAEPNVAAVGQPAINRASIDPLGGASPGAPTACTGTGTPAGCAVAPAVIAAADGVSAPEPAVAIPSLPAGGAALLAVVIGGLGIRRLWHKPCRADTAPRENSTTTNPTDEMRGH